MVDEAAVKITEAQEPLGLADIAGSGPRADRSGLLLVHLRMSLSHSSILCAF